MPSDELFKEFEEVILKNTYSNWVDANLRDPKPSWKDLAENRIAISSSHLKRLKDNLETEHFCILVGDKDRGKTWLSYALGYDLVKQNKRVKYALVDENFDAEAAWTEKRVKDSEAKIYLRRLSS
jgi:polynucleotide 5'-kinase involved in rRNA processing